MLAYTPYTYIIFAVSVFYTNYFSELQSVAKQPMQPSEPTGIERQGVRPQEAPSRPSAAIPGRRPVTIFDCHHPKHYLTLRQLARRCQANGIDVLWTIRDKDVTVQLAVQDGFTPNILTRAQKGWVGRLIELFAYDWKLYRLARRHRPFALMGNTFSVAHVGALARIPSIVINDDDKWTNPQYPLLAYLPATRIVLPDCINENWGKKTRHHHGLHELAYLHPDTYRPNPCIREQLGVGRDERLFLIRLVANTATHDVGVKGFSAEAIDSLLQRLSREGRVFISSEGLLSDGLAQFVLPLPISAFHDVLAACYLVVTDGNTVAAEAAVLGIPSVRMTSLAPRSYLSMLEHKFHLTFGFHPKEPAAFFAKLDELLAHQTLAAEWQKRRREMLASLQDPTDIFWDELSRFLQSGER